jgi:hypothetical protein
MNVIVRSSMCTQKTSAFREVLQIVDLPYAWYRTLVTQTDISALTLLQRTCLTRKGPDAREHYHPELVQSVRPHRQ